MFVCTRAPQRAGFKDALLSGHFATAQDEYRGLVLNLDKQEEDQRMNNKNRNKYKRLNGSSLEN